MNGQGIGYFGGGWLWHPAGYWWYHNPGFLGRVYYEHWNPHWAPGDMERIRNNVNVYNRWGGGTVVPRAARPAVASTRPVGPAQRDLYAGKDGRVYERQNNNWMERNNSGAARKVQPTPELQGQRESRSFGFSRSNEFGSSGFSRGFPRSMPSPRFGGFGGGGRRR
jgi:hypothetical protein